MREITTILGSWLVVTSLAFQEPPPVADRSEFDPPGVRATQLACSYRSEDAEVRFRGTVVGRRDDALVLLTAAHCLGPADAGRRLRVARGEESIEVEVVAAARNPGYGRLPGGYPGADNALALVKLDPDDPDQATFRDATRVAEVADRLAFGRDGQVRTVVAIDQRERAHAFRAGNYDNPRWLQWGPSYRPIPGDSGSGVFAYRIADDPDEEPVPVLVGVVTDRDQLGGGASLVARELPWLAEALRRAGVDGASR